jgi:hypothetical protein
MSSNLTSIIALCAQRKKQQLFNVPPSRLEIVSPYDNTNITKFDLDMRRKAEVLKYDQGNTKKNNLTKKQLFTQVMNGRSAPVAKSYITINTDISNAVSIVLKCDNESLPITTLSSASGVPNDYINNVNTLYYDPTVPLYNYINPILTRSYGIINSPFPTSVINYSNYTNVNTSTSSIPITTVEFTEATTNGSYTLSLSNIPLAIQIYGKIKGKGTTYRDFIKIKDIFLNVYYNSSVLIPNSKYVYNLNPFNTNYIVDVSNNALSPDQDTFSETVYIGNISIFNILLYSSPGYIYDFYLNFKIEYLPTSSNLTDTNASIIANVTNAYLLNNVSNNSDMKFSNKSPDISNNFGVFTVTAI